THSDQMAVQPRHDRLAVNGGAHGTERTCVHSGRLAGVAETAGKTRHPAIADSRRYWLAGLLPGVVPGLKRAGIHQRPTRTADAVCLPDPGDYSGRPVFWSGLSTPSPDCPAADLCRTVTGVRAGSEHRRRYPQ